MINLLQLARRSAKQLNPSPPDPYASNMNYIIFDLEATCWRDRGSGYQSEIIEIGALSINQAQQIQSEFSQFVRPQIHPLLSPFCTELTT
ncbi:MAG: exonuclease domain-containing protein, partial [Bacteroidota bacterium]